jgi:hypothetical protein
MTEQQKFEPCGWGVFWDEKGQPCSVLKSTERGAIDFAIRLSIPGASIEQVYRAAPGQST